MTVSARQTASGPGTTPAARQIATATASLAGCFSTPATPPQRSNCHSPSDDPGTWAPAGIDLVAMLDTAFLRSDHFVINTGKT